jgi:hypothetical protein
MLSLSSIEDFHWRSRLYEEGIIGNLTALHVRIGSLIHSLIEAGEDQPSHAEVAMAARTKPRAVREATKRLRGLGLLDWQHQHSPCGDQIENRYWLTMPATSPAPRPDLRRHRARGVGGVHRPSKEESKNQFACEVDVTAADAALRRAREGWFDRFNRASAVKYLQPMRQLRPMLNMTTGQGILLSPSTNIRGIPWPSTSPSGSSRPRAGASAAG